METVITPIVKDKKGNLTMQGNYRPIAVTCVASKLLESMILHKYSDILFSSDHQFGFKKKHSTDMCVFALKEIVGKYNSCSSPVYLAFMDASKAFDKVNHWILFKKLVSRGLPSVIVRLMIGWYTMQDFYVKWSGCLSDSFKVSNGVRQGGVLSPVLYNVFMDDLSVQLSRSFSGCAINGNSANHLMYADDSILLAPSPQALQDLLDICENYARKCDITYNEEKTVCMCVKPSKYRNIFVPNVYLNQLPLKWIVKKEYLGVWITEDLNDNEDIQRQLCALYSRGNMLLRKFRKCSDSVKARLFKTFCSNLYGASLWSRHTKSMLKRIKVAYNNVFRMLMSVGRREVSAAYVKYNVDGFYALLRKNIYRFKKRIFISKNSIVASITDSLYFAFDSKMNESWLKSLYVNN